MDRETLILFITPFYEVLSHIFSVFSAVGIACLLLFVFIALWLLHLVALIFNKLAPFFRFININNHHPKLPKKSSTQRKLKTRTNKRVISGDDNAVCCMNLSEYANNAVQSNFEADEASA